MADRGHGLLIGATGRRLRAERLRSGLVNLEHRTLADPAEAYAAMAPVVPLRQLRPLVREKDFYQEIGLLQINQLRLMSYTSAPVQLVIEPTPSVLLLAGFSGFRVAHTRAGALASRAGCGLLLPPGPIGVRGGSSSAVMALLPEDLARAAAAMAGHAATQQIFDFQAQALTPLQARQLHTLLQHLDACLGCHPALPVKLGLDDVLLRLVVGWLRPQVLEETTADRRRIGERAGSSSFDELIDYIRANLDQPLRLSDLETRSHYSSRALQYAFRQRLGCTPRQWIREQRLERAMAQLEQGGRGCSIRVIALACGYRHMGLFSSDFKKRFGITPSAARWRTATPRGGDSVLVQVYAAARPVGIPLPRPAALNARGDAPVEEWPYLDQGTLLKTRSRKVCMTCHWFRHHAGVNCIPVLTCQLHQGLIAHGEHLVSRCQGWTDDMTRQQGWAPEVA